MSCRIQRILRHDLTPWITSSLKVKFALQLENSKTTNLLFPTKSKTMIKSSLNELMPVYLKLFNTVLDLGAMPQMWCDGLITPTFKCGTKSDPSNYRGICISSCIGKLFCSVLNQRLLKHVDLNNILHKSQIGFLTNTKNSRSCPHTSNINRQICPLSQGENICMFC